MVEISKLFSECIRECSQATGRKEKEDIIRRAYNSNRDIIQIFKAVFDPEELYYMSYPKQAGPSPEFGHEYNIHQIKETIRFIKENRGTAAIEHLVEKSKSYSPHVMRVFTMILNRNLFNCGVGLSTLKNAIPELDIKEFKVMKGESIFDSKKGAIDFSPIKFPCYAEVKYDGFRCSIIADYKTKTTHFLSSDGKPLPKFLKLSQDILSKQMQGRLRDAGFKNPTIVFDGEICFPEADNFQLVSSIMGSDSDYDGEELEFRCFAVLTYRDYKLANHEEITELTTEHMRSLLNTIAQKEEDFRFFKKSKAKLVQNLAELKQVMHNVVTKLHREGLMIKHSDGGYHRKRVKHWHKWKFEDDYDARITGFQEGTGKFKGMLGAFIVDYNGQANNVGGSFNGSLSDENRKRFWEMRASLSDKFIRVRSCGITAHNNFRHARFINFHEGK